MKQTRHITLDIEKLPEGYYVATSRDVQGLVAQAKTFEKTVEIAQDLARKLLRAQGGTKKTKQTKGHILYPMEISV